MRRCVRRLRLSMPQGAATGYVLGARGRGRRELVAARGGLAACEQQLARSDVRLSRFEVGDCAFLARPQI